MLNNFSKTLITTFMVIACLSLASQSSALIRSLPELAGGLEMGPGMAPDFGYPGQRVCDFVIPGHVTSIQELTFVLSGQWHAGEVSCNNGFEDPDVSPMLPPIAIFITSDAFPGDYFVSSIMMPDDSFENLTGEFTSSYPPGVLEFDDLLGADLHCELIIDWGIIGICSITLDSYGILSDVELHLTGTVPTVSSTLDQVKSLYR